MDYINYYKTLGVEENASKEDIGKAYRKLARQYHPDRNKDPGAEDEFKRISEAYEVLKDEEKRAQYDRYGAQWQAQHQNGAPFNYKYGGNGEFDWGQSGFSTFFEQLFGASGRRGSWDIFANMARGSLDREAVLPLSVQEAYRGGRRQISLQDPHTGQQRTYAVNVPPGVRDGQRIRLAGQGAMGTDGHRGHLYLQVQLEEGAAGNFRLEGPDVYTQLDIMPWTAALGGKVRLQTLDGTVEVKVPAGSSSGRRIRLRGRGYTAQDGSRGDLYAELRIVVPERLTSEQQQLFEKLTQLAA